MSAVRPEAEAAAAWWASRLGNATHDAGKHDPSARRLSADLALFGALLGRTFSDEQREAFRRELAAAIEDNLAADPDGWRPEDPNWGSYCRAIHIDYGSDPVLTTAAERAGISLKTLDFPIKTCMWINPGHVKVREGYGADVVTVWDGES